MQQELLIAILAGLGGMFGWGLADFFAKKTIDQIGDIVSLTWAHILGTVSFFVIILYQVFFLRVPIHLPSGIDEWTLLAFFGALQAFVYYLAYQGFGKGMLAVLNPVFASYAGLAALLSILVFGEQAGIGQIVALAVIFTGILLLSLDTQSLSSKKFKISFGTPGFKEIFSASILAALWTVFWDRFIGGNDWMAYALSMYAFMTITIVLIAKSKKTDLTIRKRGIWKFLFFIGIAEIIAYISISLGFSTTSFTSVVALLSGSFSLPTIVLARVFLKEKLNTAQTVGGIIVIAGIIFLSMR